MDWENNDISQFYATQSEVYLIRISKNSSSRNFLRISVRDASCAFFGCNFDAGVKHNEIEIRVSSKLRFHGVASALKDRWMKIKCIFFVVVRSLVDLLAAKFKSA